MKPQATLRQWPTVNFLDEIEAPAPEPQALYDLACREPAIRRAYRKVQSLGKTLQARIGGPTWAGFADARTNFQTALFELAFNLGFENGIIRTRNRDGAREAPERLRAASKRRTEEGSRGCERASQPCPCRGPWACLCAGRFGGGSSQ